MKEWIRRVIPLAVCVCMLAGGRVRAVHELTFVPVIDNDTGVVVVTGSVSPADGRRVTMTVFRPRGEGQPGYGPGDLVAGALQEVVFHIADSTTDTSGQFAFRFTLAQSDAPGWYAIRLGVEGMQLPEEGRTQSVLFVNGEEKDKAIAAVNGADAGALGDVLTAQKDVLGLYFPPAYEANKAAVHTLLVAYRTAMPGGVFTTVAQIRKALQDAVMMQTLNTQTTPTALAAQLEAASASLGLDTDNEDYVRYTNEVCALLIRWFGEGKTLVFPDVAAETVSDAIAITAVNQATRSGMDAVLRRYAGRLQLDVTGAYADLDAVEFSKALVDKDFDNIEDIRRAFGDKLDAMTKKREERPSGGGGGGSSGPSKTVTAPQATPVPTPVPATPQPDPMPFADLGETPWATQAVGALYARGVVAGTAADTFAPLQPVTREQLVKMTVLAYGVPDGGGTLAFEDVNQSDWSYPYIRSATAAGIIQGMDATRFGLGENVTRQDVAVILYRAAVSQGGTLPVVREYAAFSDQQLVAPYAADAVQALYQAGVIDGTGDGMFEPNRPCTRAEAAKLLYTTLTKGAAK